METKEYIVSLKRGIDYDKFWDEMENDTIGLTFVPDRRVDIINNRDVSLRQCNYALTDEEAKILRGDDRVYAVEIPNNNVSPGAIAEGNYSKVFDHNAAGLNWGLARCINLSQVHDATLYTTDVKYTYTLDGTGVDIVLLDSGIQVDHPEFFDNNGVSRVQQIDWYVESGVSGTMPVDHYTDTYGHGTHTAAIAAGRNFGWAKNAHIYSIKVFGGSGTIDISGAFDLILGWHNAKKAGGNNRPTVVNMSISYLTYFDNMVATENAHMYRGVPWTGTVPDFNKGMVGGYVGPGLRSFGYRVGYADVGTQELIDAGVHVCKSSGNCSQKIDVEGGLDFDNYFTAADFGGVILYYNRGSSPYDNEAMIVGSVDYVPHDEIWEMTASTGDCGPGVDFYAPGGYVMSAYAQNGAYGAGGTYQYNPSYKQIIMSGTSMAAPQASGVSALLLQMEPTMTPAQLKSKIVKACASDFYSTGLDNDYSNFRSIKGGYQRILYMPYSSNTTYSVSGGLSIPNIG